MATGSKTTPEPTSAVGADGEPTRAYLDLVYAAASMYHLEDATQAQVSARLGTSRTTVGRLLSDAKRLGIVRTQVVRPQHVEPRALGERLQGLLGLRAVRVGAARHPHLGVSLGPLVHDALAEAGIGAGDVLLVSSGRSTSEVAEGPLPLLPGVRVVPTIGGMDQADPWYQPNETTRRVADKLGGTPVFLFAPALPDEGLYEQLTRDPGVRRVLEAWDDARFALVGIGAPPSTRTSLPSFVDTSDELIMGSVGDVASRFYDADGVPVHFTGWDRMLATPLERLSALERCIAVAVGAAKVPSLVAAARAGYLTDLVTDVDTALALLSTLTEAQA